MNEHKPKPAKPKFALREPAQPLAGPDARPVRADHPVMDIFREAAGAVDTSAADSAAGATPSSPSTGSSPSTASSNPRPATPSSPPGKSKRPASPPRPAQHSPHAPSRDFTKTANSIVRTAVPAGVFGEYGGKSKELYDYLYSLTRGAVVPRRKVRVSKAELMRGAGIGSEVTLRKNLGKLGATGLVRETVMPGTHGGNEYEVLLPEEAGLAGSTPSTPSSPGRETSSRQDREGVEALESRGSSPGANDGGGTASAHDQTFLKDVRPDDDDVFAGLVEQLKQASREVTGKEPSTADAGRWREVGEFLALELKGGAARTVISSAPAFLVEHLRRRLSRPTAAPSRPTPPGDAPTLTPQPATEPPTDEELVSMFVGFLHQGMGIDEVEGQLSASVDREKWPDIKRAVLERYERERGQMRPPD